MELFGIDYDMGLAFRVDSIQLKSGNVLINTTNFVDLEITNALERDHLHNIVELLGRPRNIAGIVG